MSLGEVKAGTMHTVVCVKQVPDTTEVRIDPETNTLKREGVPSITNPFDAHAVEEALRLKDRYGGKVTVLSMGPKQATATLKRAISYGVHQAILMNDRVFAGSDTLATSYAISQAIRAIMENEPVDLIMCGKQTIDGDTAQVGPGIASRLGIPQLSYVIKVDFVDLEKREIQVQRQTEEGRQVVKTQLPALLTILKEINHLRYGSLKDLLKAYKFDPIVWTKDSFALDPSLCGLKGSPTVVKRIFAPPHRGGTELIVDGTSDQASACATIIDKLVEKKVLEVGGMQESQEGKGGD
jgi:electron transfer flavoprotein beta subunit